MTFHAMRPETLERRARERAADRAVRLAELEARMLENANRDGPGSFWAEYLADWRGERGTK